MEDGNKKKAPQRAAALAAFSAIAENVGSAGDPHVVPMLAAVLKLCADKEKSVREAAETAGPSAIASLPPYATKTVVPKLLQSMDNSCRSQTVVGALSTLEKLAESNPTQVAQSLPEIVPVVSACMVDITDAVKVQAKKTMQKSCVAIGNKDIEKVIPTIIEAVSNISQVPETIHALASCTFVQTVEGSALAIVVPLLARGFKEKKTAIKRQCAKITANMSKLVEHPMEAAAFLPELMPALDKARVEISDPEARDVCDQAYMQLCRIEEKVKTDKSKKADHATIVAIYKKVKTDKSK